MHQFNDFNLHVAHYESILSDSIKISGTTSDYFNLYKILIVSNHENTEEKLQILDFGCGNGKSAFHFRNIFPHCKIKGIDISNVSIEIAKSRGIKNAEFMCYNSNEIPFTNSTFDIVFVSMVFHHIQHDQHIKHLTELYNVLKPGGRLYIFEHNPWNFVTRSIVSKCIFDKGVTLIKHKNLMHSLSNCNFNCDKPNFTLFFPRKNIFNWLIRLEPALKKVPLGAQYYIKAIKTV